MSGGDKMAAGRVTWLSGNGSYPVGKPIAHPTWTSTVDRLYAQIDELKQELDRLQDENAHLQREIAAMDDLYTDLRYRHAQAVADVQRLSGGLGCD